MSPTRRTRPTIADEAASSAAGKARPRRSGHEIEHMPAISAGSEHWGERILEDQAEGLLQRERDDARGGATRQDDVIDFDIAAWFALEQQDEHDRCITECWYG